MTLKIIHKNNTSTGQAPAPSDLDIGEIAINSADAKLYIEDNDGAIQSFTNDNDAVTVQQFTQAGSGAVQRTVESKLRDIVSVKDFGAVGNGTADDTDAIKAAIAANGGRGIYFPRGSYKITETIDVTTSGTQLIGSGSGSTYVLQHTPNVDSFTFKPTTAGTTSAFLNSVRIEGINISHGAVSATATSGAGVRFLQCNQYKLFDVTVNNAPEGITVQGGQLGSLKSFQVFTSTGLSTAAGTALIHFRQAPVGASFQACFTVEVEDFRLSATKLRESCISIQNADGLAFSNGYVAYGSSSLVNVKNERDTSYISAVSFVNVYFDCVGAGQTPTAIIIPADGFSASYVYGIHIGSGCVLGNGDDYGIVCRKPETMLLSLEGATVLNFGKWAVDCEGSTALTDLHIQGSQFNNVGDNVSGAVRAATGRSISITGNTFSTVTNVCINLSGSWISGTITGNNNSSNVSDLSNTASFTGELALAGNSSRNTDALFSWRGLKPGNVDVNDASTLDWYLEGTFTPALSFGGSSTGIAYSANIGKFTRIGNRIMYSLVVNLSSKGSSTGALRIDGLPYDTNASYNFPAAGKINSVSNDLGATQAVPEAVANSKQIRILKLDTSGGTEFYAEVTDVDIKDNTNFSINGTYFV